MSRMSQQSPPPDRSASTSPLDSHSPETVFSLEEKFKNGLSLQEISEHAPVDDIQQEEIDALYARDMFNLSMEERNEALHDVHGISKVISEDPAFLLKKRSELRMAIERLAKKKTFVAYEQVMATNPYYITSESFEVMFLRATRWNPKMAAKKSLNFLEAKLDLYGPSLLTRSIRIEDLDKDDKKCLESGFFQFSPVRDVSGRAILCGFPPLLNYKNIKNLLRSFVYLVMVMLEDPETQKSGLVMVGTNTGKDARVDRSAVWNIQRIYSHALPMRIVSIHYCYDNFAVRPMMTLAMLVMGASSRVRFRAHYGTFEENQYKLLTFGIPKKALPISMNGEVKRKNYRQWLKNRYSHEEDETMTLQNSILIPGRLDVLFGRGKPIQSHIGNLRYQVLLDKHRLAYEEAKKYEKLDITKQIVAQVQQYSGRFLKAEGAGWKEVDDTAASQKISHAFRTRRRNALEKEDDEP